jgi:hypothetical protein
LSATRFGVLLHEAQERPRRQARYVRPWRRVDLDCAGRGHTEIIKGNPNPKYISTSYVERQNLTMRMHMRRFTRLTNAFSKKLANHAAAVALHYMWYNFVRVHQTLRVTPAMESGTASHVWSIDEIVGLLDAVEKKAA